MPRKLLCEYGPVFYRLSVAKEQLRHTLTDLLSRPSFATTQQQEPLPDVAMEFTAPLIDDLMGGVPEMQRNKAENLAIAAVKLNGLMIYPGEVFSFWRTVGDCNRANGYQEGRVMVNGRMVRGFGGGLCELASHLHNLVLRSPLQVVELHHHSDALFPDLRARVPYERGGSVLYSYLDYRFRNDTDQPVQLIFQLTKNDLKAQLRSSYPFPHRYQLLEENHHFAREGEAYYRNSRIFRLVIDKMSDKVIRRELLHINHSRVLYDPALIPRELLREQSSC